MKKLYFYLIATYALAFVICEMLAWRYSPIFGLIGFVMAFLAIFLLLTGDLLVNTKGAYLYFTGIARRKIRSESFRQFGKYADNLRRQKVCDTILATKARAFSEADGQQTAVRNNLIAAVKKGKSEPLGREKLEALYNEQSIADNALEFAKKDFWRFYFYVQVTGLKTFPHMSDYLCLS